MRYKCEAKEEESSEESEGENSEAESHNDDVNVPEMDQSKCQREGGGGIPLRRVKTARLNLIMMTMSMCQRMISVGGRWSVLSDGLVKGKTARWNLLNEKDDHCQWWIGVSVACTWG